MPEYTPRYLAPFHPKRVPHYFADVLIIGGGLAGLRAALAIDPSLSVLVVTKDRLQQSNSTYAQGGIAGVLDPEDCFEDHIADTLNAGGLLCDRDVVEMVVREAPHRIQELIDWGTQFDSLDGGISLGREGGHSHHRIAHALGDATGKEIMRAVIEKVRTSTNIQIWENAFTLDVLTHEGACRGALISKPGFSGGNSTDVQHAKIIAWAKSTILCTGGAGQIYRESTNPPVATGDGHAIVYRAGAELRDMEFMQFHPTVLYVAGTSRSLITEAMRGEGAHLVDCNGDRFMLDVDKRAELAPRDVVCKAISAQMKKTSHPNVYLDLRHLDSDFVHRRFPGISAACGKLGIDIAKDKIPVRPGAHYMIGGVTVDQQGLTTVPGLWAAGEVTSSGLHGANRLASNSLLEGLVFGARAGEAASRAALEDPGNYQGLPLENPLVKQPAEPLDWADIRNSLISLMWRAAAVGRERELLADASTTIDKWCRYVLPRQFDEPSGWELQNMLAVSRVVVRAALAREESRGVHLRSDFPNTDDAQWNRHLTFCRAASDN